MLREALNITSPLALISRKVTKFYRILYQAMDSILYPCAPKYWIGVTLNETQVEELARHNHNEYIFGLDKSGWLQMSQYLM